MLTNPHEEVVGFNVAMNEVLVVNVLESSDHLVSQHEDGFEGETTTAEVEEILQTRSKQIHHKDVVVALVLTKPPDLGDSHSSRQDAVDLAFVEELRVFGSL